MAKQPFVKPGLGAPEIVSTPTHATAAPEPKRKSVEDIEKARDVLQDLLDTGSQGRDQALVASFLIVALDWTIYGPKSDQFDRDLAKFRQMTEDHEMIQKEAVRTAEHEVGKAQ